MTCLRHLSSVAVGPFPVTLSHFFTEFFHDAYSLFIVRLPH